MGGEWAKCWLKCIPPPGAPISSNHNWNRISFILSSTSNLRLLSKFFNCSETYNANGSPASFGLSKTSMHFAINFCFCSVGFTRLRLALFSTRDLLESEFNESFCASSSCSLSPSMTDCGFESFKVEVLVRRSAFFPWMGRSSYKRRQNFGTLCFTFLRQFSPTLCS